MVVAGGEGTVHALRDRWFIDTIRRLADRSRRVTSVCSGAFLLAEAGLLDGRRATTHWSVCDVLARLYPAVDVDPEPDLRPRRQRLHVGWRHRRHGSRPRVGRGRPRTRCRARSRVDGWCCSSAGPAINRSSVRSSPRSSRSATTCARCSAGSPSIPMAICTVAALSARAQMSERSFRALVRARGRRHSRSLRRTGPRRGWRVACSRSRTLRSRASPARADSEPRRRCVARSCARCAPVPPSTGDGSRLVLHRHPGRRRNGHRNPAVRPNDRARRDRSV